jgi:hypothetical protein
VLCGRNGTAIEVYHAYHGSNNGISILVDVSSKIAWLTHRVSCHFLLETKDNHDDLKKKQSFLFLTWLLAPLYTTHHIDLVDGAVVISSTNFEVPRRGYIL